MNDSGSKRDSERPPADGAALTKPDPKGQVSSIPSEIIQATRGRLDPNVILIQVTQRVEPAEMVEAARQVFGLIEEYDQRDLELFRARTNALIDARIRDPDEIDKRKNNATRRSLKGALVGLSTVSLGGGIAVALVGGPIVVAALLLAAGGLGIAMIGPLASGESVTSNDVVRVITAMQRKLPSDPQQQETEPKQSPRQKRKRR